MKKVLFGIVLVALSNCCSIPTAAASELADHTQVELFQTQVQPVKQETDKIREAYEAKEFYNKKWKEYTRNGLPLTEHIKLEDLKTCSTLADLPNYTQNINVRDLNKQFETCIVPLIKNLAETIWIPKYCAKYGADEEEFKRNQTVLLSNYKITSIDSMELQEFLEPGSIEKAFRNYGENQLKVRQAIVEEIKQMWAMFCYLTYNSVDENVQLED